MVLLGQRSDLAEADCTLAQFKAKGQEKTV